MTDNIDRTMNEIERLEQVSEIVSAYVSNNAVSTADLPRLIAETHKVLVSLAAVEIEPAKDELKPAVPIKKSVTPDYLISLEDGRKFKSMKRHLAGLGMTPDDYRAKWGLPSNYPMVAPNYAATRSALAKSSGLGRKPIATKPTPARKRSRATKN